MTERAFTLIEMVLVLALVGVLTTVAAVNLSGRLERVERKTLHERLAAFDRRSRAMARRRGEAVTVRLDLVSGRLTRRLANDRQTSTPSEPFALPAGFRFDALHVADRGVASTEATLSYNKRGWSRSYALGIIDARREPHRTQWLVVAGLTGVWQTVNDEEAARDIVNP